MTYLALARAGFRRWSSYRAATLAGVFTNTVFGFIRVAILLAALRAGGNDRRLRPSRRAHLHVGHAGAHHDDRDVELGRPRDADPDRRHRHRPPTPDRPAGRLPQRRPGPRRCTSSSRAGCRRSSSARSSTTCKFPESLGQWIAFARQPRARGRRELRDALHREPRRVLGARLARARSRCRVRSRRCVRVRDPASRSSPRGPRSCSRCCRGPSMIQMPIDVFIGRRTGPTLASGLAAPGVLGDRAARGSGASCSRRDRATRRRAGWLTCASGTAFHMCRRLVGARVRGRSCSTALSFALNTDRVVRAHVHRLHRRPRAVLALRRARRLDAAGDRVALRPERHRHRDRRHAHRPHRHDPPRHPLRPVRRRAAAARGHAAASDVVRPRAAPASAASPRPTVVLVYALVVADIALDARARRSCCRSASSAARVIFGAIVRARRVPHVLDGRQRRGRRTPSPTAATR